MWGLPKGVGVLGGGGQRGKIGTTVVAQSIKYTKKSQRTGHLGALLLMAVAFGQAYYGKHLI